MQSTIAVHAEPSFHAAVHDAVRDEATFYDLRLDVPSAIGTLAIGITAPQDYQVTARAYTLTEAGPPPPALVLNGRKSDGAMRETSTQP